MASKNIQVSLILSAYDRASRVINAFASKNEARLMSFSKRTSEMGDKAFKTGREFGAIGLAAAGPLGIAIKAAADYEKLNIALKTSFQGNALAAKRAFSEINSFAAKTPYSLEEVMTGFIKLKNMGLEPGQKALTAYGNIASGMGKSLNDMVEAVADAATGEFERLKEFGIKASSQGSKVTFTFQGVKTTVGKNAAEIEKYLQRVGQTKFAGGIESESKSIYGQWSTLKDNATAVAATFGRTLIPALNSLFQKIGPVLSRLQNWAEKNPKTAKTILMIITAVAALSIAISGLSFAFGGVMKAMSFASGAGGIFLKLLKATTYQTAAASVASKLAAAGTMAQTIATKIASVTMGAFKLVMIAVNAVLAMNPFILIGMAVIAVAFLIYKYWDNIKAFFVKIWAKIKELFWKVVAWMKEWGLLFLGPIGFIIKYWDKIKAFFSKLWEFVKGKFSGFIDWLKGIPERMYNAGVNIVKSIWEGIKSFINKPIDAVKGMVQKIRNFLPFSPAKEGPLRDIHRIRLVETISESIKPDSMVNAMRRTTTAAVIATQMAASSPSPAAGRLNSFNPRQQGLGSTISVSFSPTIYMTGGAGVSEKENLEKQLKDMMPDLIRMIEEAVRKENRRNY
jgi:hypothetical protein